MEHPRGANQSEPRLDCFTDFVVYETGNTLDATSTRDATIDRTMFSIH